MPTLYVTAPSDAAGDLAQVLVEEHLAACVNRVPCTSTYRWEGEIHEDEEEILLVKTTSARANEAVARIEAIHPHDVPCIEGFEEDDILPSYAEWVTDAVAD